MAQVGQAESGVQEFFFAWRGEAEGGPIGDGGAAREEERHDKEEVEPAEDEVLKRVSKHRHDQSEEQTDERSLPVYTAAEDARSEEHTSELQSRQYLVCRLLLEKKNTLDISKHLFTPVRSAVTPLVNSSQSIPIPVITPHTVLSLDIRLPPTRLNISA